MWRGVSPPTGRGLGRVLCSSPEFFFNFLVQNGLFLFNFSVQAKGGGAPPSPPPLSTPLRLAIRSSQPLAYHSGVEQQGTGDRHVFNVLSHCKMPLQDTSTT